MIKKKEFWEELIICFPLVRHEPHSKRRLQQFFFAAVTCLASCYLAAKGRIRFTKAFPRIGRRDAYRYRYTD
jgi:hypothetical protein